VNILVLNCGSSSIKYQLIDTVQSLLLAKGSVERIGMSGSVLTHKPHDRPEVKLAGEILDHIAGVEYVLSILLSKNHGVIRDRSEIKAVGHRVVHGGEAFSGSVLLDNDSVAEIRRCIDFAPLHNPHNLRGIDACKRLLPGVPMVAVFDTAFHQKMPDYAFMYGLPMVLYKQYAIRRYGFHGTSHFFLAREAAAMLDKPLEELKLITCHLGNGCSIAAVDGGVSVDTSMGFTPLEGLLMGTRSGDLDPAVVLHIMGRQELTIHETTTMLNKHAGLLGVSGVSSDMRDLEEAVAEGNTQAALARKMFCYRIKKYIGSYIAVLGGVDAIIFSGGIGEHDPDAREVTMENMDYLGCVLDREKNAAKSRDAREISAEGSRAKILVIPTNEELVIAQETQKLVS
jgi:acetate kinase